MKNYFFLCEVSEYFNKEIFTCEMYIKGEIYNSESKQCENKEEENKTKDPEIMKENQEEMKEMIRMFNVKEE